MVTVLQLSSMCYVNCLNKKCLSNSCLLLLKTFFVHHTLNGNIGSVNPIQSMMNQVVRNNTTYYAIFHSSKLLKGHFDDLAPYHNLKLVKIFTLENKINLFDCSNNSIQGKTCRILRRHV